jgi:hypothetical protein
MNERIKQLAEQADLLLSERDGYWKAYEDSNDLERFAELVRQDERERLKAEGRLKYVMPKGCGKRLDIGSGWVADCGDSDMGAMPWLCDECKARGNT